MITLGLVILCAVGAGIWLIRSGKPGAGRTARAAPGTRSRPSLAEAPSLSPDDQLAQLRREGAVWGVMLRIPPGRGCTAASEIKDKRFALERAPRIPVRGCDALSCTCGYLPLRERRRRDVVPPEGDDRRNIGRVKWDQDF